jgi:hypothetical protein
MPALEMDGAGMDLPKAIIEWIKGYFGNKCSAFNVVKSYINLS